jgi:alkyldihydroxyacetonephosphate synthase
LIRWNGWGFRDTRFELRPDGFVWISGSRYPNASGKKLPSMRSWFEENLSIDTSKPTPSLPLDAIQIPEPQLNRAFLKAIEGCYRLISFSKLERIIHSRGHTAKELYELRHVKPQKAVDCVVYPSCHDDVVAIVEAATKFGVAVMPYGGGTSVSYALLIPENESRMVVSLDMKEMNRILWINRKNGTALVEAGAVGRNLEEELNKSGLTLGHEPDSHEFSSLGGWVSTRASGMMKNRYGNIEDIVQQITLVTPTGVIERQTQVDRISAGPDLNEIILGHEGTLGVVTQAVVKVFPFPECVRFGSIIFPDFASGFAALYEIERAGCKPVSIRLMDNMQFQFGQAVKPEVESTLTKWIDTLKKHAIVHGLGFDPTKMVVCTLQYRGTYAEVARQERELLAIAKKHGGLNAGAENGHRGYFLTFVIAYLRDFGFEYGFISESFETTVPWDKALTMIDTVKQAVRKASQDHGIPAEPFVSARVTQLYETSCCVYFYFGFLYAGQEDPSRTFEEIEHAARETILACGGSVSHHHGIGKLRTDFLPGTVGESGMTVLKSLKQTVDPENVFCNGNLGLAKPKEAWPLAKAPEV